MTCSSNLALDAFETFINKEGESVKENLGNHFRVLDSHFIAQNTVIGTVSVISNEVRVRASRENVDNIECVKNDEARAYVYDHLIFFFVAFVVTNLIFYRFKLRGELFRFYFIRYT